MIAFERIVGFQWDGGNARKSSDKHGVSQAEAEQVFFNEPLLIARDMSHSRAEPRFHAPRYHGRRTPVACHVHASGGGHQDPRDFRPGYAS